MKQFLLAILLCSGTAFAQTTFVVKDARNKLSKGVGLYYRNKMIGKTDEEGKATVVYKISKGDSIKFVNSWNYAWYVAEENYATPRTVEIKLQPVEMNASQSPQPPKYPDPPVIEKNDEDFPFVEVPPVPPHYGEKVPNDNEIHMVVDEQAEFPGGKEALEAYLKKNLRYPESAKEKGIEGKCYVKFIVRKNGKIENITLVRAIADCPECTAETIGVIKSMPKWKPARIAQKDVDAYFNLPVTFKLEK